MQMCRVCAIGVLHFGQLAAAVDHGAPRPRFPVHIFQVDTHERGASWGKKRYQDPTSPDDYIESELIENGIAYAINVLPVDRLYDRTTGRVRYAVTIYNFSDRFAHPVPDAPSIYNLAQEGPFFIEPKHIEDSIQLYPSEDYPAWLLERLHQSHLYNFEVVRLVEGVYRVPEGFSGRRWIIEGSDRPVSRFVQSGQQWTIDARPNRAEHLRYGFSRQTALVNLVSWEDPDQIELRGTPGSITREGPWKIVPDGEDSIVEFFEYQPQPEWHRGRFVAAPHAPNARYETLKDFFILAHWRSYSYYEDRGLLPRVDIDTDSVRSRRRIARRYEHTCIKPDTGFYLSPDYTVNEHFVFDGVVKAISDGANLIERQANERSEEYLYDNMPQSIEVRAVGGDRVIAQTVHTDHLDFRFDIPVDERHNGRRDGLISALTRVLICVLGGSKDVSVSLQPSKK